MSGQGSQQKWGRGGKKRPKSYYIKCANQKRVKRNVLEPGMKGFLVTCNAHEDQATRECYNILNEYADKLYGPEQLAGGREGVEKEGSRESGSDEESEEDIEKALQKEVEALKDTKPHERRFQRLDCSAKNCLFIKTNIDDPSELGHQVLSDIAKTQVLKSRFALRLLPVQITCKAIVEEILKSAEELIEPYFRVPYGSSRTFSVLFKARNNNSISRDEIVPKIGQMIKGMNPLNSCDYHAPDFLVLVEVVLKVACMSVVKDFYVLRKYNLHEVAVPKPTDASSRTTASNATNKDSDEVKAVGSAAETDSGVTPSEAPQHGTQSDIKLVEKPLNAESDEIDSDAANCVSSV